MAQAAAQEDDDLNWRCPSNERLKRSGGKLHCLVANAGCRRPLNPKVARMTRGAEGTPKRGVFVIECLDENDPGSEGQFLRHMFRLMEVPHQYVEVRTKDQFLALLVRSPYEIIHITTHGSVIEGAKGKRFVGLWFPDGHVDVANLKKLDGELRGHSVVITACMSGQRDFVRGLITKGLCRYVVAPSGSPKFHNSIFFAHILYHQYFFLHRSMSDILKRYDSKYKNPHQFAAIPLRRYGLHFVPD